MNFSLIKSLTKRILGAITQTAESRTRSSREKLINRPSALNNICPWLGKLKNLIGIEKAYWSKVLHIEWGYKTLIINKKMRGQTSQIFLEGWATPGTWFLFWPLTVLIWHCNRLHSYFSSKLSLLREKQN